ncbi:MAG: hypothetical protein HN348_25875, partial [Proteobacteria bacterium]|nr:hypothetical protein [Pseudomonadota bacterium]
DQNNPLEDEHFLNAIYLDLAVNGTTLSGRQQVVSVPFAVYARSADTATNTIGGFVDVSEVRVDGVTVIDQNGVFLGTDTLLSLYCLAGETPVYDGTDWGCEEYEPIVQWDDIDDRPAGLDDGDDDTLTVLAGVCTDGQVMIWDDADEEWWCGDMMDGGTFVDIKGDTMTGKLVVQDDVEVTGSLMADNVVAVADATIYGELSADNASLTYVDVGELHSSGELTGNSATISTVMAAAALDADSADITNELAAGSLVATTSVTADSGAFTSSLSVAGQSTDDRYVNASGDSMTGSLLVDVGSITAGTVSDVIDRAIAVRTGPDNAATLMAYGSGTATGALYLGQDLDNGGGIAFNGDTTGTVIGDGEEGYLTFFRRTPSGGDIPVFDYHHDTGNVRFFYDVDVSGALTVAGLDLADTFVNESGDTVTGTLNAANLQQGGIDLDDIYVDIDGDTMSGTLKVDGGDVTVGLDSDSVDRSLEVRTGTSNAAMLMAYGSGEASGGLYLGQDLEYGGGIAYNGDTGGTVLGGGAADYITFFRRTLTDGDAPVFDYEGSTGNVRFFNKVDVAGTLSVNGTDIDDTYVNASGDTISGTLNVTTLQQGGFDLNELYINTSGDTVSGTLNATTLQQGGVDLDVTYVNAAGDSVSGTLNAAILQQGGHNVDDLFVSSTGGTVSGTLNASALQQGGVYLDEEYVNITGDTMTGNLSGTTADFSGNVTISGYIDMDDGELRNVRTIRLKDFDDDSGGADTSSRLFRRDGAWMFYNGGV